MAPAALLAEERVVRGVPRELSTRRPDGMVASSRAADWPPSRRAFTATGTLLVGLAWLVRVLDGGTGDAARADHGPAAHDLERDRARRGVPRRDRGRRARRRRGHPPLHLR